MTPYRRLLGYLRPYVWPHFCAAIACMLLFSASTAALPFVVRDMVDRMFVDKDPGMLIYIPLMVVLVFAVRAGSNFGQIYLMDYAGHRIIRDLRSALCEKLQWLSLAYIHRNPSGTLLSRVTSDVGLVRVALTSAVASLARNATSVTALTLVAFYMDWVLAAIAFVAFPAAVLPVRRLTGRVRAATRRSQASTGTLAAILQESLQGSPIVKAFGMERYELERFNRENREVLRHSMKASRARAIIPSVMEVLAAIGIAGVLWYGGASVMAGGRTAGEFFAFITAMLLVYEPFKHLSRTLPEIHQGIAGGERIFDVLDAPLDIADDPDAVPAEPFADRISFRQVSFGYREGPVLKGIDLEIRRGETVALVGTSGAGKTTLSALLPRFYDVTSGGIALDGTDVRKLTLASLRRQIAIVTQHTFLFNDSVRNNISYGDPSKDMEEVVRAAKAAHAHDFIMELPMGYDTVIGELGMKLSGGQRQRIAIARAVLKNAPILILDEATSALDSESERLVQDALDALMENRTSLVIAHRLSTIRNATRIVVLAKGAVVEEGTHKDLLARRKEYSRLYHLQAMEGSATERKYLH
ncbi:MAG: ABC transporter transmembrane domain-containing protein [Deltaproteobacteria bacterium]|nr:ABC transporter transmembrane domain-containing protein [Deltaproteobacteria bacterium]